MQPGKKLENFLLLDKLLIQYYQEVILTIPYFTFSNTRPILWLVRAILLTCMASWHWTGGPCFVCSIWLSASCLKMRAQGRTSWLKPFSALMKRSNLSCRPSLNDRSIWLAVLRSSRLIRVRLRSCLLEVAPIWRLKRVKTGIKSTLSQWCHKSTPTTTMRKPLNTLN